MRGLLCSKFSRFVNTKVSHKAFQRKFRNIPVCGGSGINTPSKNIF